MGSSKSEMLLELKSSMQSGDVLKAKAVLKLFKIEDRLLMRRTAFEISRAEDVMSVHLILFLLGLYPNLGEDVPTIKDVLLTKLNDAPVAIAKGFSEFLPEERMLLCQRIIKDTAETFHNDWVRTLQDPSLEQERQAFVDELTELREVDAAKLLKRFWADPNEAIRDTVQHFFAGCKYAATLTELMHFLSDSQGSMPHRSFWENAIFHLPMEEANQLIGSPFAQLRTLAKTFMCNAKATAIPYLASNLEHNTNVDVQIHSLNVLGEMGIEEAVDPIRDFLYNEPTNANLRFAAFDAFGLLPITNKAHALIMGFSDEDLQVRIAAARAIDRSLNDSLLKGVARMIAAHDRESLIIAECILEAESARLFAAFKDDFFFRRYAVSYLKNKAHPDLKAYYLNILKKANDHDFLEAITDSTTQAAQAQAKPTVFVVDDSRMILVVYRGLLHKLGCDVVLFEDPREALQCLKTQKPDFLFTDLNMPHLTGIELTQATRLLYPPEQLPIIMVTTQTEQQDDHDAQAAGISQIIRKPFTQSDIEAAMEAYR